MNVPQIVTLIIKAKKAYYSGFPIMRDSTYDRLEDDLKKADPLHPVLGLVGYEQEYEWWTDHYREEMPDKMAKTKEIFEIALLMSREGSTTEYVMDIAKAALEFDGMYDLMVLWRDDEDKEEREQTICAMTESLIDIKRVEK